MTRDEIAAVLAQSPPPEAIRHLPEAAGGWPYLPADWIVEELTQVFGWDGWEFSLSGPSVLAQDSREVTRGGRPVTEYLASAQVEGRLVVTCDGGALSVIREGLGAHTSYAAGSVCEALEGAVKAAATDALKRAASSLGRRFGLDLKGELLNGRGQAGESKPARQDDGGGGGDAKGSPERLATAGQIKYLEDLAGRFGTTLDEVLVKEGLTRGALDRATASNLIERMKGAS